jgi:alkylhydroperoxidase family enzyme
MFANGHPSWPARPERARLRQARAKQPDRRPASVSSIPLAPLPDDVAERVAALGAHQVNLYRALAHAPGLLRAWMDFAWLLRGHTATSRRLRELMILRTAQLHHSPYEWHQHRRMAAEEGVPETQVAELEMWRTSTAFDECEKAALALTDAIVEGDTTPEIIAELDRHFGHEQRVELTVTAAFYAMVPRILDSLGVPIEGSPAEARVMGVNGDGAARADAAPDGLPRHG